MNNNFITSTRPHILMISNHGIHDWEIIPGLPDTGGQNIFVNQFCNALAQHGFKITVVNRGGYLHPKTGGQRKGLHYKDENQRILFLEDGFPEFVRKEDMDERLPFLDRALQSHFTEEGIRADFIVSHYWDGAKLGMMYNHSLEDPVKHIWVPHSLGAVKKRNVNPQDCTYLRMDERIANENRIIAEIDEAVATSAIIQQSLLEDYEYQSDPLFLPPCVDTERYRPHHISENHPVWSFLSRYANITPEEIRQRKIITEISRTDTTKRKDVLIKAFAQVKRKNPYTFLVTTIDDSNKALAEELVNLIHSLDISDSVAVLGSVWDELPDIYAVTDIYCTPSIMEGFGMTPQEAAATGVPVVSSHLVPFVTEYLSGNSIKEVPYRNGAGTIKIGLGAIVVPADDVDGFTCALDMLLSQETMRKQMGNSAYNITIPYFTWENMVRVFLEQSNMRSQQ